MRRYFAGIAGFVAVDQAIKLVIWNFFFGQQFTLIPGLLRFHPIINEKLSWGGNYLSLLSNPVFINLLNIFLIAVYLSAFLYYRSIREKVSPWAAAVFTVGMAGALCSLIDKLFWGGSLDYVEFSGLFIFDLKDCYLSVSSILFLILALRHLDDISLKDYLRFCFRRTPKQDR